MRGDWTSQAKEYSAVDIIAQRWAECAIRTQSEPMTILDVCRETRHPFPHSADDLDTFVRLCDVYGVRTNVSEETFWREILAKPVTL